MSELGERYKMAESMVLHRYATEKNEKGHSQAWKIVAINEDRKSGKDSGVMKAFIQDVESTVTLLESAKPIVENLCKEACQPSNKVEVKPAEPVQPESSSPPTSFSA